LAKVPFKVSARAARLIGRENVATSQGAVTELVKNGYDADATVCAVLFLPRWKSRPVSLSAREYGMVVRVLANASTLFVEVDGRWHEKAEISTADRATLDSVYAGFLDLWIIDNGHGMSAKTIEDHWMVIGTDAKELNGRSVGGRVVTGAKGIGRFALDRLGQECEMLSAVAGNELAHWLVDWTEFEGAGKIISDVEAILETEAGNLTDVIQRFSLGTVLPKIAPARIGEGQPIQYQTGTAIRISLLNDSWDQRDSLRLKETLEALLPPHDRGNFDIFVFDHRATDASGFIDNFPPDQFDYRLQADVKADGKVDIRLTRQEIDVANIRPRVFQQEAMQRAPFRKEDFDAGEVEIKTDISSMLGVSESRLEDYISIGPFSFTLYFFKLSNPTSDNLQRFPQKNFDVVKRRRWLNSSGGIRLYRDNFRVRPYGEPNSPGYDWLLLGERTARNPAPASRLGWRVPPQQVAGTIHISKDGNPILADQSNREGIMNERAFSAFREIVIGLLREFEKDRAYILQQFSAAYEDDNPELKDVEEGRKIAKQILQEDAGKWDGSQKKEVEKQDEFSVSSPVVKAKHELRQVSHAYNSEVRKNEVLRDNIQVMRGMATLGTVLVSFTHELKQIRTNIDSRSQRLADAVRDVVDEGRLANIVEIQNPFRIIERLRRQDEKVSRWVTFALSAVSPAKRRRQVIDMGRYIEGLSTYWDDFLKSRQIVLCTHFNGDKNFSVLAHEIDLDSVFYNLINNSVEALVKPGLRKEREIRIDTSFSDPEWIEILYQDNGPGLSNEFNLADDIFLFGISSKKEESSGDAVGTGLGMWLLRNVIDDYGGTVSLNSKLGEPGFSLSMRFPTYKAGS